MSLRYLTWIANLNKTPVNIPGSIANKTDRHKYLNPKVNQNSQQFQSQIYNNLENNRSWAVLKVINNSITLSEERNNQNVNKSIQISINTSIGPFNGHSRNISHNEENNLSVLHSLIEEERESEMKKSKNLPYHDTFDNGGTDYNEPLASARYKNLHTTENDSISTERGRGGPVTSRVRHHRNISHNSFPSEDSNDNGIQFKFNFRREKFSSDETFTKCTSIQR